MTTLQHRPRDILASLPLALFYPDPNTLPSPISLPARTTFPSTSSSSYTSSCAGSSSRAQSTSPEKRKRESASIDREQPDTVKRLRSRGTRTLTPKERAYMRQDDLGTGKSPARRLFVNELDGNSRGITGAVALSLALDDSPLASGASSATPTSNTQRTLAPSPPISAPQSPRLSSRPTSTIDLVTTPGTENGAETDIHDIHDIGFTIYAESPVKVTSDTQTSSTTRQPTTSASAPASPSRSILDADEDKENARPTITALPPYLASPNPSRPRSRLRESAINVDVDAESDIEPESPSSNRSDRKGKGGALGGMGSLEEVEEEEDVLRRKAKTTPKTTTLIGQAMSPRSTRGTRRTSPRRIVGRI